MTTNQKIALLRKEMEKRGLSAYVIPTADPHLSEYTPDRYQFRRWISGFTGSAGTVVVTTKKSGLWTDGRYYIQAENQIADSEIELFRMGQPDVKTYVQYLRDELKEGEKAGICGKLFSHAAVEGMKKQLSEKGIELNTENDLSFIWKDCPPLPNEKIFLHDVKYCGEDVKCKLGRVREEMKKRKLTHYAVNKLDCVMWLYNIRGNDIPCCPFAVSYALVGLDKAYLYINSLQVDAQVKTALSDEGVEIRPLEQIYADIEALDKGCTLGIDFKFVNSSIASAAKTCTLKNTKDIITPFKGVKNETENKNLLECYENDATALVKGFYYIFDSLKNGKELTECDVYDKLIELRAEQPLNMGPSFDTIAAYKANAAMMHYNPKEGDNAVLKREGMLLIDSGGQYLNGTTDITRTLVLGKISDEERRAFTLVLKSAISLIEAKFLKGTAGANLDILAREPLWKEGIDYKCGTGHGVGFFLNVHEGPQNFSQGLKSVPLEPGMNVTVEPGIYIEGKFGIRTENDVVVKPWKKTEHGEFYRLELISYVPIDVNGIEPSLLSPEEKAWLNNYHEECRRRLLPRLTAEEGAWLKEYTREIC